MRKIIWLVVSCLLVAALLLASCAPAAEEEEEEVVTPEKEEVVAEEEVVVTEEKEMVRDSLGRLVEKPKYGGVFTEASGADPVHFDPIYAPHQAMTLQLTNEELMKGDWSKGPTGTNEWSWRYDIFPDPHVQAGCLATGWELTDPETIVYHIRNGVHFHDKPPANGREMTADDVVFCLRRVWESPASYVYITYPYLSNMENVEESIYAPDKWTVVVKSLPGKTGQVYEMASDYNTRIFPPEVLDEYGDMEAWEISVGTGPFTLVDYVRGSAVTFERNPNYWGKDPLHPENTLPYLDGVKWLIIPDASTRIAALRTGKIDILGAGWEEAGDLMKTNPELEYVRFFPATGAPVIYWRTDTAPFDDKRVRQGLAMAVNNQEMADTYYGGNADLITWPVGPMPELEDIYISVEELPESTRQQFEYHPDKARELLAEAGYPDGFKTSVFCTSGAADLLSIVKAYWADIDVELDIQVREYAVYMGMLMRHAYEEMIYFVISSAIPFKFTRLRPGAVYNWSHVDDPQINEVIKVVDENYFDESKRHQAMKDLLPYILDQCYIMLLPGPYIYTFWQPWVKSYHGENEVGYANYNDYPIYIWLDQDLKEEMTGRR